MALNKQTSDYEKLARLSRWSAYYKRKALKRLQTWALKRLLQTWALKRLLLTQGAEATTTNLGAEAPTTNKNEAD